MAATSMNIDIQAVNEDGSSSIYINSEKRKDQNAHNAADISGLAANLTAEEDIFIQFMETFLIEVYRCTICKSCFTQKSVIQSHIKIHHWDGFSKLPPASKSVDASVEMQERGKPEDNHGLNNSKEKILEKENIKTCTAAISNALEVLVGLGTPTLLEAETGHDKHKDVYDPQGKGHPLNPPSHQHESHSEVDSSTNRYAIYNFSEVPLRMHNPTKDLNQSEVRTDNIEVDSNILILDHGNNAPSEPQITENMEVLLGPSKDHCPSHRDITENPTSLDTTLIEGLPGNKQAISVMLTHRLHHKQKDSVDIDGLVRSASESNPEASIITIVTHSGGDKPFEMLQFKKSSKSDAIIPTAQSLGIVFPYPKQQKTSKRKFACLKCPLKYVTEEELSNHMTKKHLRTNTFLCEICGIALATKAGVKNHVLAKHSSGNIYQCNKCDYQTRFEKHFRNHKMKHSSNIWCKVCNQTFTSTAKLNLHCQSPMHANKVNPLTCPHCDYTTYKQCNLRVHTHKHTGMKPYQCVQCPYASADASTLKKHVMAKHSKIRPHRCRQCDFSSIDKKGLTIHMRKHTGERPFKCTQCDFAAKRQSVLTAHIQTHKKAATGNIPPQGPTSDGQLTRVMTELRPPKDPTLQGYEVTDSMQVSADVMTV